MKKKLITGVLVVVALGAGAFIMISSGVPEQGDLTKLRGTDGYYEMSDMLTAAEPCGELLANLSDGAIIKLRFDAIYRLGKEWRDSPENATAAFAKTLNTIRSELIIVLSNKASADFRGSKLLVFQEELIKVLNNTVFPEQMARVEKVVFKDLLFQ